MFFVQMSGFPGSGKSTLAREIAARTGAVIIDHDVVKTALLQSTEEMDAKLSGKVSYNIDWALIEFLMAQQHSVIFDSPCLYDEMIRKGTALANNFQANYKYVECMVENFDEIHARLTNRESKLSQIKEAISLENFQQTLKNSKKPAHVKYLVVDSSKPLASYIQEVMDYILT